MNIVVLMKQVPDTYSDRTLRPSDGRLDRESSESVVDEIDTRAIEAALQLAEESGGEVTLLTMGPEAAADALRKGLSMGATRAMHVVDDALAGSDALRTSEVLAAAIRKASPDLVISGNSSTDGGMGVVPSMVAERLQWPQLTSLSTLRISGRAVGGTRVAEGSVLALSAELPVVVSVTEKVNEPRYPNFKGIMAAKKKPLDDIGQADLDAPLQPAACEVLAVVARPPKAGGVKVTDEGDGGRRIAAYLREQRLL